MVPTNSVDIFFKSVDSSNTEFQMEQMTTAKYDSNILHSSTIFKMSLARSIYLSRLYSNPKNLHHNLEDSPWPTGHYHVAIETSPFPMQP